MTIEELLNSYFQCDAKVSEQLDTTETDSEGEGTIPDAGTKSSRQGNAL